MSSNLHRFAHQAITSLAIVVLGASAAVGSPWKPTSKEARALIKQGNAAFEAKQYEEAAELFEAAWREESALLAAFNATQALRAAGAWKRAIEWYDLILADGGNLTPLTTSTGSSLEIYTMLANGTSQTNVTSNAASDSTARWSPNGLKLALISTRGTPAQYDLWTIDTNGANPLNLTADAAIERFVFAWSNDSSRIAYQVAGGSDDDVSIVNANATGKAPVVADAYADTVIGWSPDGTRIYFASERDGNKEVYSILPGGTEATNLTSNGADDFEAHWIACP